MKPVCRRMCPLPTLAIYEGSHNLIHAFHNILRMALRSDKQVVSKSIRNTIRHHQVTLSELSFSRSWILNNALQSELFHTWKETYTEIFASSIGLNSNLIGSHVLHKLNYDSSVRFTLKHMLLFHDHPNKDRYFVRHASASADSSVVRIHIFLDEILYF